MVGTASAQFSPFSSGFGGLSSSGSSAPTPFGSYSPFRPFSGLSSSSGLYGSSPSLYGAASTNHPYYGASPYASGTGPYASGPYTTSFSSQPHYSTSLGSPHPMSKDPATSANTQSAPAVSDRFPGSGLISNFFNRHRRPSFFSGFRRGQPTAESGIGGPRQPVKPTGNFNYHPLPDPYYPPPPPPPPPPPYSYPNPGHYSGSASPEGPPDGPYDHEPDHPPPGRSSYSY